MYEGRYLALLLCTELPLVLGVLLVAGGHLSHASLHMLQPLQDGHPKLVV